GALMRMHPAPHRPLHRTLPVLPFALHAAASPSTSRAPHSPATLPVPRISSIPVTAPPPAPMSSASIPAPDATFVTPPRLQSFTLASPQRRLPQCPRSLINKRARRSRRLRPPKRMLRLHQLPRIPNRKPTPRHRLPSRLSR